MMFFTIVGMVVSASIGALLLYVCYKIAGNIRGGWIGAARFWRVRNGRQKRPSIRALARHALHCWPGRRYNGSVGEYWDMGGMQIPLDGRDRIRRYHHHDR